MPLRVRSPIPPHFPVRSRRSKLRHLGVQNLNLAQVWATQFCEAGMGSVVNSSSGVSTGQGNPRIGLALIAPTLGALALYAFLGEPKWEHTLLHSTLEAIGATIAVVLGYLFLKTRSGGTEGHSESTTIWVATALIAMGLLDGFHALIPVNSAFFWSRGLSTLIGGAFFAFVWLPEMFARNWIPYIVMALSLGLGVVLMALPESFPQMFGPGGYTFAAKVINVLGGAGCLAGAVGSLRGRYRWAAPRNLYIASHCALLGVAAILFSISHMWGAVWWFFHLLRFFAYLVLLRFLFAWLEELHVQSLDSVRQDALSKLEAEKDRLRRIFMDAPTPIGMHEGPDHRINFVNRACEEIFGARLSQVIGKSAREMMPGADHIHAQFDRVYKNGETIINDEVPVTFALNREGAPRVRYFKTVFQPTYDGSGKIDGLITYNIELTEQVLARRRLEETGEDLRKAVQSRDEFLSIASHELRTPLSSLKMQLQMGAKATDVERGLTPPPEKIAKVFSVSIRQIQRLDRLIEDLLSVSRIHAGKLAYRIEEVNLAQLVRDVCENHGEILATEKIEVELDLQPDVVGFWDKDRLEQVVVNLLSNSVKYGAGRPILISLRKSAGESAQLAIKDSGIGIEKEKQDKIFDRFERAVSATNISGLGIGLYIARAIVEAHKGTIAVASKLGEGATFTVALPCRPEAPKATEADAS